jgi:hypothetical protein
MYHINFEDLTYTSANPLLWSMVETQFAIIVVNLPLLRPVLARVLLSSIFRSSKGHSHQAAKVLPNSRPIPVENTSVPMDVLTEHGSAVSGLEETHARNIADDTG